MNRRDFIATSASAATLWAVPASAAPVTRRIPASGEAIPAIGMGSWITFDVGEDPAARAQRVAVLRTFFDMGGRVVDSSPMYGSSPMVIGHCLQQLDNDQALFAASKVWIPGADRGRAQMAVSRKRWGIPRFELMQVHNMLDWRAHLPTLQTMKDAGQLNYTGVTTSHGRRHDALAAVIREQPFDFVQLSYNIANRSAEERLLPLAADHGRAVVVNRPFQTGALFRMVAGRPLPLIAQEIAAANWAQFFLKFIISHPAVTCAIPATSRVDHMVENMGALTGPLPDERQRRAMVRAFEAL